MTRKLTIGIAIAAAAAFAAGLAVLPRAHAGGDKKTSTRTVSKAQVTKMTADWPKGPRSAVKELTGRYGNPDGVTPTMVVWNDSGPFKRTIIHREPLDHNFPKPHKDYVEQFINYDVPPEKFDELAQFDGSVIVDRTAGEMSARCDKEAMNILALNLAQDIIEGEKNVEEARLAYARTVAEVGQGEKPMIVQKLMFNPPQKAGFPDEAIMDKVKEKVTRRDQ